MSYTHPDAPLTRVGITGAHGFIGTHLSLRLGLRPDRYAMFRIGREDFQDLDRLRSLVGGCDTLVHLAGVNRSADADAPFRENVAIAEKLIAALESLDDPPHVIFASSTHEDASSPYGQGKRAARERLEEWAERRNGVLTTLVVPNVYGPFCRPYYNSVVATFCYQLTRGEVARVVDDRPLHLIYVDELVAEIIRHVEQVAPREGGRVSRTYVAHTASATVSEVLAILEEFRDTYLNQHRIPRLEPAIRLNLFNTFRSYIDLERHFPVRHEVFDDVRGAFAELARFASGGQASYSRTAPGSARGDHVHTRKVERFSVVYGRARIELRRMDRPEMIQFELDGERPAFVDIPVWYAHRLVNTGKDELITFFWVNEPYDAADPDTYPVVV